MEKDLKVHPPEQFENPANHAPHNIKQIRTMNRKDFFKTSGRLLILGGITASAGYLVLNNKVTVSCSVSPTCNSCGKYAKCELPQAQEIKKEDGQETVKMTRP